MATTNEPQAIDFSTEMCFKPCMMCPTKNINYNRTTDVRAIIDIFLTHLNSNWAFGEYFKQSTRLLRPFFDIDCNKKDGTEEHFTALVEKAKARILKDFGITKDQLIGTTALNEKKWISQHWFVKDMNTTLEDMKNWYETLDDDLKTVIDLAPYKTGALRHHFCHKIWLIDEESENDVYAEDERVIDYDGNTIEVFVPVAGKTDEMHLNQHIINLTFVYYTLDTYTRFEWKAPEPIKKETQAKQKAQTAHEDSQPSKITFELDMTAYGAKLKELIEITKQFPYDTKQNCEFLDDVIKWNMWSEAFVRTAREDTENTLDDFKLVWGTISKQFAGYDATNNAKYWDRLVKTKTLPKTKLQTLKNWIPKKKTPKASKGQAQDIPEDTYEAVKKRFEETYFYIVSGTCFGEVIKMKDGSKSIQTLKRHDLLTATETWKYQQERTIRDEDGNYSTEYVEKPFVKKWLEDKTRRTYLNITCDPNPNFCDTETYNAWTGLPIEQVKEAISDERKKEVDAILDTYLSTITKGNQQLRTFVENYTADLVQRPHRTCEVAIVFYSDKHGAGKTSFAKFLSALLGDYHQSRYGIEQNGLKHLQKDFNGTLAHCMVLCSDEVNPKDGFEKATSIKQMITAQNTHIENKGKDSYPIPNKIRHILTSNDFKTVQVEESDRRFCAIEVPTSLIGNVSFWNSFYEMLQSKPDMAYLYNKFKTQYDISNWKAQPNIPKTEYVKTLKELNKPLIIQFVEATAYRYYDMEKIGATELMADYKAWMVKNGFKNDGVNATNFATLFMKNKDVLGNIFEKKHTRTGNVFVIDRDALKNYIQSTCGIDLDADDDETIDLSKTIPEKDL